MTEQVHNGRSEQDWQFTKPLSTKRKSWNDATKRAKKANKQKTICRDRWMPE